MSLGLPHDLKARCGDLGMGRTAGLVRLDTRHARRVKIPADMDGLIRVGVVVGSGGSAVGVTGDHEDGRWITIL